MLCDINDGSADDRVELGIDSSGKPTLIVRAAAATVASITATNALTPGVTYSIAAVVGTNNARLYVDGIETGTADTSLALPATPTVISVGQDWNAANQPNGHENSLRIYPRVLNANEIKKKALN